MEIVKEAPTWRAPKSLLWIGAGVFAIVAGAGIAAYYLLIPGFAVLFQDLKPAQTATIISELDKQKVPYELDDGGSSIKVPAEKVNGLRVQMQASDVPLKGSVGFELFNGSDLGMTDFAQKVTYQRALQGELARTIASLDDVESARVHLSIPDSSMFRRTDPVPRAAVVVFMKRGGILSAHTAKGIQRIVAAAVPDLQPEEVVITDAAGTLETGGNSETLAKASPRLAQKLAIENYYTEKLGRQLDHLVGPGASVVVVDVLLGQNDRRVTTDQTRSGAPVGQTVNLPPLPVPTSGEPAISSGGRDAIARTGQMSDGGDQWVSKRVEEIVSTPGSIERLTVSVVLRTIPTDISVEQIQQAVASAAGVSAVRGDVLNVMVVPSTTGSEHIPPVSGAAPTTQHVEQARDRRSVPTSSRHVDAGKDAPSVTALVAVALLLVACAGGAVLALRHRRRRQRAEYVLRLKQMLSEDRQRV
ncbi:hypothetical protein WJ32_18535 (plasmid) [Burkholderia ubonensis]|uniref:Flagellar M-ring protein n=1 Tax=Burkholderia ubonensis TaxID=101571 RepID=A0A103RNN1_9BURK|nr:flagellar basal-body MS-ring/collar protein FliF [Burkholderia ubonensis]AOJ64578.1 hypothetical protein WJ32_18535 [Burkholderia ubonensis]KVG71122.1 hypothetical protein WJ33_21255 [Burkholderia ubonensis]